MAGEVDSMALRDNDLAGRHSVFSSCAAGADQGVPCLRCAPPDDTRWAVRAPPRRLHEAWVKADGEVTAFRGTDCLGRPGHFECTGWPFGPWFTPGVIPTVEVSK